MRLEPYAVDLSRYLRLAASPHTPHAVAHAIVTTAVQRAADQPDGKVLQKVLSKVESAMANVPEQAGLLRGLSLDPDDWRTE